VDYVHRKPPKQRNHFVSEVLAFITIIAIVNFKQINRAHVYTCVTGLSFVKYFGHNICTDFIIEQRYSSTSVENVIIHIPD